MSWYGRGSRQERGYGAAWDRQRERILVRDNYLCQAHKRTGKYRVGNEVHHKLPRAQGGTDDESNLETLCHDCHLAADARAQGRKLRPQIGVDGYPV